MRLVDIQERLDMSNIPRSAYSLNGGFPNEAYCIDKFEESWEVYYSERGERSDVRRFDGENEACSFFVDWVTKCVR